MADCEHILIDGYNLAHAWPQYRDLFKRGRGTDVLTARLSAKVRLIHDFEGVRTTLVFDGKGTQPEIERPDGLLTFSLLYTPAGMTADCMIEQLVAKAVDPAKVVVVSNDQALRAAVSALGARVQMADEFENWLRSSSAQQSDNLSRSSKRGQSHWQRGVL